MALVLVECTRDVVTALIFWVIVSAKKSSKDIIEPTNGSVFNRAKPNEAFYKPPNFNHFLSPYIAFLQRLVWCLVLFYR